MNPFEGVDWRQVNAFATSGCIFWALVGLAITLSVGGKALADLVGLGWLCRGDHHLRSKFNGRWWLSNSACVSVVALGGAIISHLIYRDTMAQIVAPAVLGGFVAILFIVGLIDTFVNHSPVRWLCSNEQCGKALNSSIDWDCGFCGKRNERFINYSFLNRCEHCGNAPSAYECPWPGCRAIHHLKEDADEQHRAKLVPEAAPVQSEAEKAAQFENESKELNRKMQRLRDQATLAELEMHLERVQRGRPDDKARFEEWRRKQADDLLHRVTTLKESYEAEERLIVEIKSDAKYGTNQTQLINQVKSMFQSHRSSLPSPRIEI
jgi:hypothetical protein